MRETKAQRIEREHGELLDENERLRAQIERDRVEYRRLEDRCTNLWHEAVAAHFALVELQISHETHTAVKLERFGLPMQSFGGRLTYDTQAIVPMSRDAGNPNGDDSG